MFFGENDDSHNKRTNCEKVKRTTNDKDVSFDEKISIFIINKTQK